MGSCSNEFLCDFWSWGRVVHDWPVGGTNWRGSRQMRQEGGGGWCGGEEEYWVPQAVQMGRGEVDMVDVCSITKREGGLIYEAS